MKYIKQNFFKIFFIILSILFVVPSIKYLVENGTVRFLNTYDNFFRNDGSNKILSSILYVVLFGGMAAIYIIFIKKESIFKNIKQLLIYIGIISAIFFVMLPWTSSDIFYYMGVGELDSTYNQNPYYITMKKYYDEKEGNIQDEILEKGVENVWADTSVIYGPIAQFIFKILTKISFKNIDVCLMIFKIINIIVHMMNCYLIYKISNKLKYAIIYGLNPFMFLEFIANVHNDVIVVCFALISIYFLINKKQILPSIIFLAIATGIKYFTILLLPFIILYHFRDEERLGKRFLKCVEYGIIFLIVFALEYVLYFRDISIMLSMMVQTGKYCKSIYSGLYSFGLTSSNLEKILNWDLITTINKVGFVLFVLEYIVHVMKIFTSKEIKLEHVLRSSNLMIILFLLILATFQQWYLVWLFICISWQKEKMKAGIIAVTLASEFANSIYMFKIESWKFDYIFVFIIVLILGIYILYDNIFKQKRNEEIA